MNKPIILIAAMSAISVSSSLAEDLVTLSTSSAQLSVAHFNCSEATKDEGLKHKHIIKGIEHGRLVFQSIEKGADRSAIKKGRPWTFELSDNYSADFNLGNTLGGLQSLFWHNLHSECQTRVCGRQNNCEYLSCSWDMQELLREEKYRDNNCALLP